jgi:hypothetical protein
MRLRTYRRGIIHFKVIPFLPPLPEQKKGPTFSDEVLGCTHVVNFDALDDYIVLIKKYYFGAAPKIVNAQDMLKQRTSHLGRAFSGRES